MEAVAASDLAVGAAEVRFNFASGQVVYLFLMVIPGIGDSRGNMPALCR